MSFYYDKVDDSTLFEEEFQHAKDHLQGLVEQVYKKGNIEDFERHLEEVLCVFGLDIPKERPLFIKKLSQREAQLDRSLKAWVGYSRAYADIMTYNNAEKSRCA
jgi:hypothetical protein